MAKKEKETVSLTYGEITEVLQGMALISGIFLPDIEGNLDLGLIRKRLTEYEEVGTEAKKNLFEQLSVEKMVPVEDEAAAKKGKKEKKKVIPAGPKSEAYQKAMMDFEHKVVEVDIPLLKLELFKPEEDESEDPRRKIPNGFFQLVWPLFDKAQEVEESKRPEVPTIEVTLVDVEDPAEEIAS